MNVFVLNGPNLNLLGDREPEIYGTMTLVEIEADLQSVAENHDVTMKWVQSNHEGALIDALQAHGDWADGALINAGALTHYGYALLDAIQAFGHPVIEVHLSNIYAREAWRRRSILAPACAGGVYGFGADVYRVALEGLIGMLGERGKRTV